MEFIISYFKVFVLVFSTKSFLHSFFKKFVIGQEVLRSIVVFSFLLLLILIVLCCIVSPSFEFVIVSVGNFCTLVVIGCIMSSIFESVIISVV